MRAGDYVSYNNIKRLTYDRNSCVHYNDGYCALKNPERNGDNCLYYEDMMNFSRMKVNSFKGSLGR